MNAAYAETKLLMIISPNSPGNADAALTEGSNDLLVKPMTSAMVLEKISQLGLVNPHSPSRSA